MNDYYLKDYHPSTLSLILVTTYLSDKLTWICNIITFVPDYALNNIWKAWNNYYRSLHTIKGPSYFDHSCIWFSECSSSIQVLTLTSTSSKGAVTYRHFESVFWRRIQGGALREWWEDKNPDLFMERGKMQYLNISKASVNGF